jgi:aminoglycoside phosphotransferase (APT) family kinase protein
MLDPEQLARTWVPGRGKPLVRLLARGPWAATYRVMRDGRFYAMRLPKVPATEPPANASAPWDQRVFVAAAAAKLGPPISNADPASGILVTGWVRGRTWTQSRARAPAQTTRIARLVQRIQALSPAPPAFSRRPAEWIDHYRRDGGCDPLAGAAERRLAALAAMAPCADVLCHSDLHRLNLIDGEGGLTILDWEYAHYSDPYWDLAGWLSANDLAGTHSQLLLAAYLGQVPGEEQLHRLECLRWLYDYVCLLWSNLHPEPAAGRARVLASRLSAAP